MYTGGITMENNLGNKETMAKNIRKYMELEGYTRNDLCDLLRVPYSTLADWLHSRSYPRIDKIEKMAHLFGISKADLVEENHTPEKSVIFDVIGDISAGYDGVINEEKTGDSFAVPLDWIQGHAPQDFMLLKVRGGSMMPLIQNNDLCLIQRQTTMDYSGQIGAVIFEDSSVTLKKVNFVYGQDWMELEPLNQKEYRTMRIEGESLEHCRVIGTLKKLIRSF